MVGLGYKDFANGAIADASEADGYFMQQTIMRFVSAAARDSALSAILADGLFAFTADTGTLWVYWSGGWRAATGSTVTFPFAANVVGLGGAYGTPTVYTSALGNRGHMEAVLTRSTNSASLQVHTLGTLAAGSRPARDIMFPIQTDIGGEKTVRGVLSTAGVVNMVLPAAAIFATTNFVGFTADWALA